MQGSKSLHLLQLLLLLNICFPTSTSDETTPATYCGSVRIQEPFVDPNPPNSSSLMKNMILCKSQKLYFRTSIGLFQVSSIDYTNKLITVSHSSCSSTSHFVSPQHLSAGLPPPLRPNSLILFNCSKQSAETLLFSPCNATRLSLNQESGQGFSSCSVIDDVRKLGTNFDPKKMNCTGYSRVYNENNEKLELGTRVSFDIPDHVPNPCNECKKPYGNCGVGLRCLCNPMKCKDKVISGGGVLKPFHSLRFHHQLLFIILLGFFHGSLLRL